MNSIFLDMEFTELGKEHTKERRICHSETIQIGAVKLDQNQIEISRFDTFVKPKYSTVTDEVHELTKITDKMLEGAPAFEDALASFMKWVGDEEMTIYSWSNADKLQLIQETKLNRMKPATIKPLTDHWVDLQLEVSRLLGISQQLSLENALRGTNLDFKGKMHTALDDAANTAELFRMMKDEKRFKENAGPIIELMKAKEELTFSLGSLFDGIKLEEV